MLASPNYTTTPSYFPLDSGTKHGKSTGPVGLCAFCSFLSRISREPTAVFFSSAILLRESCYTTVFSCQCCCCSSRRSTSSSNGSIISISVDSASAACPCPQTQPSRWCRPKQGQGAAEGRQNFCVPHHTHQFCRLLPFPDNLRFLQLRKVASP